MPRVIEKLPPGFVVSLKQKDHKGGGRTDRELGVPGTQTSGRAVFAVAGTVQATEFRETLADFRANKGELLCNHQNKISLLRLFVAELAHTAAPIQLIPGVLVVDQGHIALAVFLVIEEFSPVAQVLDEFPVAVDVGMEMAELTQQRALGVARIEFPYLGVEQVIEKERYSLRPVLGGCFRIKTASLLCFLAKYKGPANSLRILENAGLDGFVLGGRGHGLLSLIVAHKWRIQIFFKIPERSSDHIAKFTYSRLFVKYVCV